MAQGFRINLNPRGIFHKEVTPSNRMLVPSCIDAGSIYDRSDRVR